MIEAIQIHSEEAKNLDLKAIIIRGNLRNHAKKVLFEKNFGNFAFWSSHNYKLKQNHKSL